MPHTKGHHLRRKEASRFVRHVQNHVTAVQHPRCYRYRHSRPVICPAVRLHGGKLQYSARIMVFSSSKVRLNMQPHRRHLVHEYGHKSACLCKPISGRGGKLIKYVVLAPVN